MIVMEKSPESRARRQTAPRGTVEKLTAYLDALVADTSDRNPWRAHFSIPVFRLVAERLDGVEQCSGSFSPTAYAEVATLLADECALAGYEQRPVDGLSPEANSLIAPGDSGVIRVFSVEFARAIFGDKFAEQVAAVYIEADRGVEAIEEDEF